MASAPKPPPFFDPAHSAAAAKNVQKRYVLKGLVENSGPKLVPLLSTLLKKDQKPALTTLTACRKFRPLNRRNKGRNRSREKLDTSRGPILFLQHIYIYIDIVFKTSPRLGAFCVKKTSPRVVLNTGPRFIFTVSPRFL